ncbi:peptidylprolyl isomerase [Corynebacterium uterequi]|uniref:Peptidyl-prolyl cis-trans isomerase n=1 Tax=Corynebacterium uterequi TaxID=1072256 RepID=A0A0G3HET2_9CORY|nr:peptidylprolyl isomerase [Corynebacterium uterequi]AKK11230.1 peptidyl-prolyl cis-trans isomerase (rotamase) - cyclophilin family [Corynebacterium uterequi]
MSSNKQRGEESLKNLERELKSRERKRKRGPIGVIAASAAAVVLIGGGIVYFTNQDGEDAIQADGQDTTSSSAPEIPDATPLAMKRDEALPPTVTCQYGETGELSAAGLPPTENISTEGTVTVTLNTNQGAIPMELDRSVAPCTVNSFEHLAFKGYFDDTLCHRITTEGIFVLQCGDPTGTGSGGPGFQFANEYPTDEASPEELAQPVIYPRGSIAMANAGADTNGSQFFLNYDDSPLAPNYTYFGQISEEGLATLDGIVAKGAQNLGPQGGQPAEQVVIESATVS